MGQRGKEAMNKPRVFFIAFMILCFSPEVEAQHHLIPENGVKSQKLVDQFKADQLKVMEVFLTIYEQTDWSSLVDYIVKTPDVSPNSVVPLLSSGHVFLNRFQSGNNLSDFCRALEFFELSAREDLYAGGKLKVKPYRTSLAWGKKWASAPTAVYLLMGIARLKVLCPDDLFLKHRVDTLYARGEVLAETEADPLTTNEYPYQPYNSSVTGDTKAEENAWISSLLVWAANMYPFHPRAKIWEEKGLQVGKFSIVRRSDMLFFQGEQVITVEEDFTETNHNFRGNPYYSIGVIVLLRLAGLSYTIRGLTVPDELNFNVDGMYGKYKTYCDKTPLGWRWNIPSDPEGDPTLMPVPVGGDDSFDRDVVHEKATRGILWMSVKPVVGKLAIDQGGGEESALFVAQQNAKVVWYYEINYLWRYFRISISE